ncbi:hypothetical protein B9Q01_02390 [Candidatus Marsarchaeota G1 archaeon OSP_D]|jgi:thiosulfate dehydrogenase [quinone] small subunit|uniref:Thiosulphate:quinone oxidoreductase small subunit DoxA domain-containing protein n=3 Tax=Candidatus Marsarchaeota group 1 TaxID=2203770 RepID=A0A2R6AGU6_9ARCH|nr:MAG: hypothetical protein B9Q01_02390 [Candidatus Marsarchaeota G1 archaeon OSP_D]PSN85513.1 MAG: hypothetical protein B9Q02_06135 [Candidatus Marsarchaeota G1 archaeon BE_D]PSN87108.1 MAG: hypothetical protein B9Q00_09725 [Candidatus Marsarchaeota G1 archaeon OSP_C]
MERRETLALTFSVIVALFILGTGQWAYGNLFGPLHNYSKTPKVVIVAVQAENTKQATLLTLNLTNENGPDAYPASVSLIKIWNTSYTLILNSTQIYAHTVKIQQAPWNLNKKDGVNPVGGFELWLGAEASFTLVLPPLSPGLYNVTLYVPYTPPVTASFVLR